MIQHNLWVLIVIAIVWLAALGIHEWGSGRKLKKNDDDLRRHVERAYPKGEKNG